MSRTIVWFRRDLRISDHLPLYRAAIRGDVVPIFVLDRALLHHPETAPARVAFMLDCLRSLDADLKAVGGRLILRYGDPIKILPNLVAETGADGIYAYTDCERIYGRVRDARLNTELRSRQMRIRWFEPLGSTAELMPYPDYRDLWFTHTNGPLVPTPNQVCVPLDCHSNPVPDLDALDLNADTKPIPPGGTAAARHALDNFLRHKTDSYYWKLSYPAAQATTGLSPYIKFGVISIRECVQTARPLSQSPDRRIRRSAYQLVARLRWSSGFHQRFRYLPQLEVRSLYSVFDDEGWPFDETLYRAWQEGQTGFPIVDAAARCLQATGGWQQLNFRIRAIYASFLSNLMGIDWRYGALHFMRHLIDGDCPIDHYQWAMQSGVTHCVNKSWTRIYNPGQIAIDRCDPHGSFVKKWLPELADLHPSQLGAPSPMSGYPSPIVDYKQARQQRVELLQRQRSGFRGQANVIPHLARLPKELTPFGSDRLPCDIAWSHTPSSQLFPAALPLDDLRPSEAAMLRTWLVAHIDIPSWNRRKKTARKSGGMSSTSASRRGLQPGENNQLSLF
ncbi:MAG: FAD-binding domain-containing protein [Cyanobacteria bacterium P01_E01_bin.34]